MAWSPRQTEMLKAMGLRLWAPPTPSPVPEAAVAVAPEIPAVSAPAAEPVPPPVLKAMHPPDARVSTMDWSELRAAVASCEACGLSKSRQQTVFGSGHLHAHWLIVGEAPGAQEDATGEAFVGPSGQLLDSMLAALGLSRQSDGDPAQRVFIANTLKCRPPANRNPQVEEMLCCAPFLQRQIALVQPRVIVAMGRFAAQALLRDDSPLGQLRGRLHRFADRPLVVTYHPSYLLRSPGEKAKAWADLCLAAAAVEAERP